MELVTTAVCYLLCAGLGYLFGCSNLAILLAKRRNFDIRSAGSRNPGASNTVITMGWKAGILVGVHDVLKSCLAALLAGFLFPQLSLAGAAAGAAAVLGHIFPVTMRFRGGKGFASYIGMALALNWKYALVIGAVIILLTLITDYIVVGTVTTVISFPVCSAFLWQQYRLAAIAAAASLVILWKHRENLVRIANGTEIGLRGARKTKDSCH